MRATLTARRAVMTAGMLAALFATGCSCGKKSASSNAEVSMRDDAILMRIDQMQAEMDNRFAMVDQRLSQQTYAPAPSYAPPAAVYQQAPTPLPSSMTYTSDVTTTAIPGAPALVDPGYYDMPKARIEESRAVYMEREYRPAPVRAAAPSSASRDVIRVAGVTTRDVQLALRESGHSPGAVDGKMGAKTKSAITSFQRAHGLKADGIVGRQTWNQLMAFLPAGGGAAGNIVPTHYK